MEAEDLQEVMGLVNESVAQAIVPYKHALKRIEAIAELLEDAAPKTYIRTICRGALRNQGNDS